MTDLRMTPKRLELLQAIADGQVKSTRWASDALSVTLDRGQGASWPPDRYITVTAAFRALQEAGLADFARLHTELGTVACRLTPSGESVLASHREASG